MSQLLKEIIDVLNAAKRPLLPDDILARITSTKHASRVSAALATLAAQGLAKLVGDGWCHADTPYPITDVLIEEKPAMKTNRELVIEWVTLNPGASSVLATKQLPKIKAVNTVLKQLADIGKLFRADTSPAQYWVMGTQPASAIKFNKPAAKVPEPAKIAEKKPQAKAAMPPADKAKLDVFPEAKAHEPAAVNTPVLDQLAINADRAMAALDTYLESLQDQVLKHLIESANSAHDAMTTYQERIAK